MRLLSMILSSILLSGCTLWPPATGEQNLTLGTVQSGIYIGMSGAEVAEILGSPNIVSTDQFRNEVWIYDRFSTESVKTEEPGTLAFLQQFANVDSFTASSRRQTESTSQKALTIIIKFDGHGQVRDYAYHVSRF